MRLFPESKVALIKSRVRQGPPEHDFLLKWMIFFHLLFCGLSDLYIFHFIFMLNKKCVFCWYFQQKLDFFNHLTVKKVIWRFGSLNQKRTKIQQTMILITSKRFGYLFLFGLVSQYSTNQNQYNKVRFKVMATYLQQ